MNALALCCPRAVLQSPCTCVLLSAQHSIPSISSPGKQLRKQLSTGLRASQVLKLFQGLVRLALLMKQHFHFPYQLLRW